jgi:hypothetical protein
MNRPLSLLAITMIIVSFAACEAKKPPEQAAVKSKNVLTALRDLGRAYEKKDLASFMADVSPNYRDRDALSTSLAVVFSKYETIHFNIQYAKMVIMVEEKGRIKTAFNWDAEWLAGGGTAQKNGGRVTLLFDPENFKLLSIDGKNPFVPQPVETRGDKQ